MQGKNYQPKLRTNDEEDQTMPSVVWAEAEITILTTLSSDETRDETPCTLTLALPSVLRHICTSVHSKQKVMWFVISQSERQQKRAIETYLTYV